jgi:hypothetical protein
MTTGALIFAFNNGHIDYLAMAEWAARNIRRHLNIPVAVVTDRATACNFDQVIIADSPCDNARWFDDYATRMPWNNYLRTNAYELTPWDQTLVLDADYVVASNQLQIVIDTEQDFLAHRRAYDITGCNTVEGLNYFGDNHMPMWWATVMMFRKGKHAELIFSAMQMIRDNWAHYRNLYKNTTPTYRNDHALSIALGIVNGHTLNHPAIPWPLASLIPGHALTQLDPDRYRIDFVNTENKSRWIEIQQDFHAMGKQQLGAIVANPC